MAPPPTSIFAAGGPGLWRVAFFAVLLAGYAHAAHGGIWIEPVIEDSPMIKKGHLEGGINGEGAHRADGKTPMMLAVEGRQGDVIEYLLENGADLSLKDAAGETAMDIARKRKMADIAAELDDYLTMHPNPSDYYATKTPSLSIVSGKDQTGSPDCGAPEALAVYAADHAGHTLVDAPVKFTVDDGSQHLLTGASSPASASLLVRTNNFGICRVNVHLPKTPNTTVKVTASAGMGEKVSRVGFTAMTNRDIEGAGSGPVSCFNPKDQSAILNGDGSIDVTWQNQTEDESCIKIWIRVPGAWKLMLTVPAHSIWAHIPPQ